MKLAPDKKRQAELGSSRQNQDKWVRESLIHARPNALLPNGVPGENRRDKKVKSRN
jgi:hypothetical protein